jgi:hydroxypyruvate reductase
MNKFRGVAAPTELFVHIQSTIMKKSHRQDIEAIYLAALSAVNGRDCVRRVLEVEDIETQVAAIAVGKAAAAMLQGAVDALGNNIHAALMITKYEHAQPISGLSNITIIEAGHPQPDDNTLKAGQALLEFIQQQPAAMPLLFLISGGTSSLVEVLPPTIHLQDIQRVNHWLLGSGLDIHAINHVRKSLSCIKAGRLATQLAGRNALALLISDVPGDDPATIGSGLLVPDSAIETETPELELPEWIIALMQQAPSAPKTHDPCFENISVEIIASLPDARHAAANKARELEYDVYEDAAIISGDAIVVGSQLASRLLASDPGVYLWGGETTVQLPKHPGHGGRNQSAALAAAIELAGERNIAFFAAGTDGTDGPTNDAGALVDGGTIARGEEEGLNAETSLQRADAGTFLEASGDLIQTGPTGTNVMDLMIGMKWN